MTNTFVVGDVHGYYDPIIKLLRDDIQLIDANLKWAGKDATLCFVGDYVDRGPQGIEVIELVMRLEREAAEAGGRVEALLGNHDVFMLAAYRFQGKDYYDGGFIVDDWQMVGGQLTDLKRMTQDHANWLIKRPAMVKKADHLIVHADALLYLNYGNTVSDVNRAMGQILNQPKIMHWQKLLDNFTERFSFQPRGVYGRSPNLGIERARAMLHTFGGKCLVHGHTPISVATGKLAEVIKEPLVYAGGLCINVDSGLYRGGEAVALHIKE